MSLARNRVFSRCSSASIENESSFVICGDSFIPQITLRNIGNTTLTSIEVQTYVDGIPASTTTVSPVGFLKDSSRTIDLNPTPVSVGNHTIKCIITKVNRIIGDYFALNNEVCGDINFYKQTYSVSASSPDGSVVGTGNYECGSQVNLSATPYNPAGYEFNRWIESGNTVSTVSNYSFIVSENRSLNAEFKLRIFSVTANCNAIQGTVAGAGNYTYGSNATVRATSKTGYRFSNWTENNVIVSADSIYTFFTETARTLIANFNTVITDVKQTKINEISKVFQNPANDILQIEIRSKQNTSLTLYIFDMKGSLLEIKTLTNTKGTFNTSFDVSKLSKGNYILNLYDEEGMASYKFIVQ